MKRKRYKTEQIVPIISTSIISSLNSKTAGRAVAIASLIRDYLPEIEWKWACEAAAKDVIEFLDREEENDENSHL